MDYQLSLNVRCALDLLEICPAYTQTPIVEISPLNNIRLLIKDETNRMGLGSFKALGGIYAVAKFLLEQWQKENGSELPVQRLTEPKIRSWSNKFTFVCASAGNHGIAVAKGAELFNVLTDELNIKNTEIKNKYKEIAKLIDNKTFIFNKESKENGELYGSIKPKEITNLIKEKANAEVGPSQIILKDDLNKIGIFKANINFHSEVKAVISIKIDKIQSK